MAQLPPGLAAPTTTVMHDQALAQRLGLSFADPLADLALIPTEQGLGLTVQHAPGHDQELAQGKPLVINLAAIDATSGPGRSLKQPIAKAIGLRKGEPHRPTVLDGTAGLGEDATLLAGLGCTVTAIEQHPVVAALLADALGRAGQPFVLHHGDSLLALQATATGDNQANPDHNAPDGDPAEATPRPEVVYLDPMFPEPHNRKAKQRKPMRLLAWLLADTPATDEAAMLTAARQCATKRVVVKRPKHAPDYAQATPAFRHTGSAVRYDIYPALV